MAEVWLVRHGETAWSAAGRHTSRTDLPLTEQGEVDAVRLRPVLASRQFSLVLSSPLRRAADTAKIAGFAPHIDDDLSEWNYGDYEGMTTEQIRETVPDWSVFTHPSPGGESAMDVADRIDRVVARVRAANGDVLLFAHGHSLRVLAARWLGLAAGEGRLFSLRTGAVSMLGWEREQPVMLRWNVDAER